MLSDIKGLARHFTAESLREYLLRRSVRTDDGCLIVRGYGGQRGVYQKVAGRAWAHIAAFVVFVGDYDPTLDVHHVCNVKDCIEPTHLRQVTRAENCRIRSRSPRCRNGHEREIDDRTGQYRRACRACNREAQRRWRERQAAEVARARAGYGAPSRADELS
ncbi:HNH endonuclease [Micromonospora sp. NPDC048830]|uniref:HNH endonuclease n=1 Tax=Micromonospora sp. NPDC048830 TaxID=3364257 RepID=UPI0037209A0A